MNRSQEKNPRSKNENQPTKAAQKGQSGKDSGKDSGNKNDNKGKGQDKR